MPLWWIDPADEKPNDRIPVYTEETGWANFSKEMTFIERGVRTELIPRVKLEVYARRIVVLPTESTRELEIADKRERLGRLRRLSSAGTLQLMLDILRLEHPPLDPAPYSHGVRETRFTRNDAYRKSTREEKYRAARKTGDPIDFARALRDLSLRHRMHGKRSAGEHLTLIRMANELVFEVIQVLPAPREVETAEQRATWAAGLVRDTLGLGKDEIG